MNLNAQSTQNPFLAQRENGTLGLTEQGASHFARLALDCMQREYPYKLGQVLSGDEDLQSPQDLHPAFYGCFDWHSSVHGHWMLIALLQQFPALPEAAEIQQKLSENLTAENILAEVTYLENASKSWERSYGWSWLLKLSEALFQSEESQARQWRKNLQPLTDLIVQRYLEFLPKQTYPIRTGVHPNTAFGLSFAWDFANTTGNLPLQTLVEQRALDYYLNDTNCPADWEPGGEDFLSGCLEEANLMQRVLNAAQFDKWFKQFLPKKKLRALSLPADVSDRSDPKIVHLDGLNLSRAWCFYRIAPAIKSKAKRKKMVAMARQHLEATIPHVASTHYEGSHWLASFAVYALSVNDEKDD